MNKESIKNMNKKQLKQFIKELNHSTKQMSFKSDLKEMSDVTANWMGIVASKTLNPILAPKFKAEISIYPTGGYQMWLDNSNVQKYIYNHYPHGEKLMDKVIDTLTKLTHNDTFKINENVYQEYFTFSDKDDLLHRLHQYFGFARAVITVASILYASNTKLVSLPPVAWQNKALKLGKYLNGSDYQEMVDALRGKAHLKKDPSSDTDYNTYLNSLYDYQGKEMKYKASENSLSKSYQSTFKDSFDQTCIQVGSYRSLTQSLIADNPDGSSYVSKSASLSNVIEDDEDNYWSAFGTSNGSAISSADSKEDYDYNLASNYEKSTISSMKASVANSESAKNKKSSQH